MKIIIDEKVCTKHKMTVPEVLLALAVRHQGEEEILENLINREVLVRPDKQAPLFTYIVTQHWSDVLDEIICDSSGEMSSDDELLELAKKMRECFPQGRMANTPYYYRCNNAEVVKKMKKFFLQYGKYPDNDIVDACKRYIAECNRTRTPIKLIKYFISKEERGKEEGTGSLLLSYLENKEDVENVIEMSDDWLMNVKN